MSYGFISLVKQLYITINTNADAIVGNLSTLRNALLNDTQPLIDAVLIKLKKQMSDTFSVSDVLKIKVGKTTNDTAFTSDAGNYYSNPYIDNTYFADRYVGTITTF